MLKLNIFTSLDGQVNLIPKPFFFCFVTLEPCVCCDTCKLWGWHCVAEISNVLCIEMPLSD